MQMLCDGISYADALRPGLRNALQPNLQTAQKDPGQSQGNIDTIMFTLQKRVMKLMQFMNIKITKTFQYLPFCARQTVFFKIVNEKIGKIYLGNTVKITFFE